MGITIKDAFTGDEDATQSGLRKWCDSALNIYHKSTRGIIIVNQSKELIPQTCINLSKDNKKKRIVIANIGQKLDYPRSISFNEEDLQGLVAVPMKLNHSKALGLGFFEEDIKQVKSFNLGDDIKIDGKLHELYLEDKEDEDTNEEEIFVLTFIPNHIIAPFGKALPEGIIEEAKDKLLALAPNHDLQPLYEAWCMITHKDYHSFIIMDTGKRKTKRRGIKPSDVNAPDLERYTLLDSLIVQTDHSSTSSKDKDVLSKEIKVSKKKKTAIQNLREKNK